VRRSRNIAGRLTSWLDMPWLRPPGVYLLRSIVTMALGTCLLLVCACLAQSTGRWELFERSGSITATIGLLLASRRYVRHDVLELIGLDFSSQQHDQLGENFQNILGAKLGLALSAFGTLVRGWGSYLRWWSFGHLVVWTMFDFGRVRRDFVRMRDSQIGLAIGAEASKGQQTTTPAVPTRSGGSACAESLQNLRMFPPSVGV
jgi:hypothetical protein